MDDQWTATLRIRNYTYHYPLLVSESYDFIIINNVSRAGRMMHKGARMHDGDARPNNVRIRVGTVMHNYWCRTWQSV